MCGDAANTTEGAHAWAFDEGGDGDADCECCRSVATNVAAFNPTQKARKDACVTAHPFGMPAVLPDVENTIASLLTNAAPTDGRGG